MKKQIAVILLAVLALSGCAAHSDPANPQIAEANILAKKKICSNQSGSRLAVCGEGSVGDFVLGGSGQSYQDYMRGRSNLGVLH